MVMQSLDTLKKEALRAVREAADVIALRGVEVAYLGRSGKITGVLRSLKTLSEKERKKQGRAANALRDAVAAEILERHHVLKEDEGGERLRAERIDITRPGAKIHKGGLHPLTRVQRDIERIFTSLGFEVVEGPEVETEWYNFDALNVPKNHPARDMHDTFWLEQSALHAKDPKKHLLLRTHISPVQVRYMEHHNPPFRFIAPGRVFRYEASDASHDIQFQYMEGMMVSKDVSLANLKHSITIFLQKIFGRTVKTRLRPSYFPFTEPSVEVDLSCLNCNGKGCSVCKHAGWLEMAGAGMVHPNVFRAAGLTPQGWQGFAFGFGIDRIAMMKYKIPDIRLFYSGDIRFLKQF